MFDATRTHLRLAQAALAGTIRTFNGPTNKPVDVFVPNQFRDKPRDGAFDVVVHFHGAAWLAEQAVNARNNREVAAVLNLGVGSGVYDRSFSEPSAFDSLLVAIAREVSAVTAKPAHVNRITLVGYSAGHGAVRAILRDAQHFKDVYAVMLLDGMHTSYMPEGVPIANGGTLDTTNLVALTNFAFAAMRGAKRFLVSHSEIFPGTYASTTETADWMLRSLGLRRTPVLRWGPRGMQQLSEAQAGHFKLLGFAGTTGPDHIDQFHAMPELLRQLSKR